MDKNKINQSQLIGQMLIMPTNEAQRYYLKYFNYLSNVNFIFSNKSGTDFLPKSKNFPDIKINNFFVNKEISLINDKFLIVTKTGDTVMSMIEIVISLDTQILSYLYRKHKNQIKELPAEIETTNII